MPVKNIQSIKPKIWIPPIYTANFNITVERLDGTVDDITDYLLSFKIEDAATEGIGNFEFEIPNPNETYTSLWTGMEIFRFYCDYASGTPTTLRFRGRIEKPSNQNNNLRCTGRSESLFVTEKVVTQTYTSQDAGYILKDLFEIYGEDRFDLTEISIATGITLSISWMDKPFWDCLQEICTACGYDCYISAGLIVKFFEQGTVTNETDAIVHDYNLVEVGDFAPDLQFVKNKIRVYGADVDGGQIIYTANDTTSQTAYGIRQLVVNDSNITTIQQAHDLGEYTLANSTKDPPNVGEITGIMIATIQPGEMIRLSSPMENLPPASYRCVKYKHEFGDEGLRTTVTINKEPKKLSHVIRDRVVIENQQADSSKNPYDMDFSWVNQFNTDTGSHTTTEIVNGVLQVVSGSISGEWESVSIAIADGRTINQAAISVVGEDLPNIEMYVSGDNGITYQLMTFNSLSTISVASGSNIKIKVRFLGRNAKADTIDVKYSTK